MIYIVTLHNTKTPIPLLRNETGVWVVEMPGVEPGSEWSNIQASTCVAGLFECRRYSMPTDSALQQPRLIDVTAPEQPDPETASLPLIMPLFPTGRRARRETDSAI